mmetsp:Transcript_20412/g.56801  ORF Transcript_20412/g.56801 Transcript_20412/m.56801 type:complete len:134 (-) Transcript_20412:28-429(-)
MNRNMNIIVSCWIVRERKSQLPRLPTERDREEGIDESEDKASTELHGGLQDRIKESKDEKGSTIPVPPKMLRYVTSSVCSSYCIRNYFHYHEYIGRDWMSHQRTSNSASMMQRAEARQHSSSTQCSQVIAYST